MTKKATAPYLITKDESGEFRITVRTTRFNSQHYPLVTSRQLDDRFKTMAQARTYLREELRAEPGDVALK